MDVRTVIPDPRLIHATVGLNVTAGVIGGPGGSAGDTLLVGVLLLKNATPASLIFNGIRDETGIARTVTLTGSATADTNYSCVGLRNTGAAMVLLAPVADTVLVSVQPA